MKARAAIALVCAALIALALPGCSAEQEVQIANTMRQLPGFDRNSAIDAHSVRSIGSITIRRIAVMPLISAPDAVDPAIEEGAADAVTIQLYNEVTLVDGWQVVPEDDVVAAMGKLPPTTTGNMDANALEVARQVSADGVLYGQVERYKERVGYDYSAASPASVAFSLRFVDRTSRQVVWSARFARTQKALSENLFSLPTFISSDARWVRAEDIGADGVKRAIGDLHRKVNLPK